MIAKIGRGENLLGALSYNQLKVDKQNGQILYTHKIIESLSGQYTTAQLARSFEPYLIANNKTEKPVLHISLNPDPKDKVTDQQFVSIAQEYMHEMGYGDQPFVVFKHTDTSRTHIHIVSICVNEEGRKISDTFEKVRSMKLCRELEVKYGLIPSAEKEHSATDNIFRPVDYKKGDVKSQTASVVRHIPAYYRFQSLGEYNALLSLFNIAAEEVKGELHGIQKQGLIYAALDEKGEKTGNPFKASLFGKHAGYTMLQEHFEKFKESLKKEPAKALLRNTILVAMHTTADEIGFKKQLQQQGINTVVRRNDTGRIYGITFIDHQSKTVWNGSRFGKDLSANVFNGWWSHDQKPMVTMAGSDKAAPKPAASKEVSGEEKPHSLFDFLGTNETSHSHEHSFSQSFGGFLPETLGEDYEELAFENQMKKKKKRKPGPQK